MDASWLAVVNEVQAAAGVLHSHAKHLGKVIWRLFLIDQKVDREEIENLAAYIKVFDAYAKSLQRAGATQSELSAAAGELLTPRLRAYLLVRGIVEAERRSGSSCLETDSARSDVIQTGDRSAMSPPSSKIERRVMQLAAASEGHVNKRIGDPGRDR